MWVDVDDKMTGRSVYLHLDKVVWCAFDSEFNEDWQCDVWTCELLLVDGSVILSDSPQNSLVRIREYIVGDDL